MLRCGNMTGFYFTLNIKSREFFMLLLHSIQNPLSCLYKTCNLPLHATPSWNLFPVSKLDDSYPLLYFRATVCNSFRVFSTLCRIFLLKTGLEECLSVSRDQGYIGNEEIVSTGIIGFVDFVHRPEF
jgi:hypothetical protein